MSAPLTSLTKLTELKAIFATLIRGRHINRLQDAAAWNELERERETYEALFAHLGYELSIDERGFAWFQTDEPAVNIADKTRNLALLLLALFERQADQGIALPRFHEWRIDAELLGDLLERSRPMLEAEGIGTLRDLEATMGAAVNYGFATAENPRHWRLLPATWRYLDHFERLALSHEREPSLRETP